MELAEQIKKRLLARLLVRPELREEIEKIEIKAPGFINFTFSKHCLYKVILDINRQGKKYGYSAVGRGIEVQVEFVSANPTGPLTIAHGRQAALGDSLANILEFLGYTVTREYYLNDEGVQMDILGNSIRVRYLNLCGIDEKLPEDAYKGSYVIEIAKDFKKEHGTKHTQTTDIRVFRQFGLEWILNEIKKDLKDFGVKFDVWFSKKALRKSGKVEKTLEFLKEKGYIYKQENAVWFKSQMLGDDKDRVVIKSDGSHTYLAPDIAYHQEKFRRGFKRIINIWGPDHHGYIPRMKAAVKALGHDENQLSVLIAQLATLYRGGKVVSMSTRAGEFRTLKEDMDEAGKDVTRFVFLSRRISSHLDFDMDVVKKESSEKPVFYIQYAHARICSIAENAKSAHVNGPFDSKLLQEPEELELLRLLRRFPLVVVLGGSTLEPCIILQYLQELAAAFHSFYNKHRVLSDDHAVAKARLVLVDSVKVVLANGLNLLGVTFPEKM